MVEREQRESTKQIQAEHLAQGATVLRPTTCHSLNENGLHGRKRKMTLVLVSVMLPLAMGTLNL